MSLRAKLIPIIAAFMVIGAVDKASAVAVTLDFNGSTTQTTNPQHTGASGTVGFSFADVATGVKVTLGIANTTSGAFGAGATKSILTGFGFDLFSGVAFVANSFVPGAKLTTLILNAQASPFGNLDVAFADNDNFLGGNANKGTGLREGQSTSLSFVLKSTTSSLINAAILGQMFTDSFSSGHPVDAVLRFQEVLKANGSAAGEGSDKLIYVGEKTPPVPLPATLPLLIAAIGGLALAARRRLA